MGLYRREKMIYSDQLPYWVGLIMEHTGARHSPSDQSPVPCVLVKLSFVYAMAAANIVMAIRPKTVAMALRRALSAHRESWSNAWRACSTSETGMIRFAGIFAALEDGDCEYERALFGQSLKGAKAEGGNGQAGLAWERAKEEVEMEEVGIFRLFRHFEA